ncbi:hypothetical protein K461DRAFT_296455 [Myriangium duriaei CBS 260.36]|uniref:Uncharacterized protein n=1 Tax=Myriangium duriaei CBS 260.36 TaxID=1168546 RepID=A0A9P4IU77_9PEZI|nr:hypothetical protein K461DRAFT_296455 [Myriangium duriaei CBS 260.36]
MAPSKGSLSSKTPTAHRMVLRSHAHTGVNLSRSGWHFPSYPDAQLRTERLPQVMQLLEGDYQPYRSQARDGKDLQARRQKRARQRHNHREQERARARRLLDLELEVGILQARDTVSWSQLNSLHRRGQIAAELADLHTALRDEILRLQVQYGIRGAYLDDMANVVHQLNLKLLDSAWHLESEQRQIDAVPRTLEHSSYMAPPISPADLMVFGSWGFMWVDQSCDFSANIPHDGIFMSNRE